MAGSPALLLLLSLGLCCTSAQGQRNRIESRFLHGNMKHPQEGQQLELECPPNDRNISIFWIRQDKSGNLHFIVSSTPDSRTNFQGNKRTSSQFEAWWRGNTYRLVVKNFTTQDEGIYFCITNINQVLHFSSGQPTFFPVTTRDSPTTSDVTNKSSQDTKRNSSQHGLDAGSSHENTPQFCHDTVIWVNLAGTCLLLLLTAITINIAHCPSKSHPDTLQSFLEPHTTEHSPLLQGMGSLLIALTQPLAGHREC
ncbi:T-cell surface glycoprotein CD8 alpha chain-like [Excalfactoria chinensis]|uniref:T-cell surface glycoprotein CD8 alpha chain-like n=1 Tax=Excalfactoria chinensis TaxID=46218 RepID=UPI003B3B7B5D